MVEVGDLLFVREYISANHELAEFDDSIHQIEFMFHCQLLEPVATHNSLEADAMQTGVEWLPVCDLHKYRFYPTSLITQIKSFPPTDFSKVYLGDTL